MTRPSDTEQDRTVIYWDEAKRTARIWLRRKFYPDEMNIARAYLELLRQDKSRMAHQISPSAAGEAEKFRDALEQIDMQANRPGRGRILAIRSLCRAALRREPGQ
jgi:hypothetical protein